MREIKIGDHFRNIFGAVHVIDSISKTGLIIHAKNMETGELVKFRFYNASGKYITESKRRNVELGTLIENVCVNIKGTCSSFDSGKCKMVNSRCVYHHIPA